MRHSSRANKGNGGQISQLQMIEHIQTERSATAKMSHTSQLEMATANEPVNPMAPAKPKPRVKKPIPRVSDRDDRSELEPVCNILQYFG